MVDLLRKLNVDMNTTALTNTFSFVDNSLPVNVVVFLVTTYG